MSAGAQVDAATVVEARQGRYWLDRESVLGPVLLLPAVIYIIALVGIPLVLAVLYSLSDVTIGDQSIDFVGLKNFRDVLNNSTFRTALQNTFVFTIVSQAVVLVLANILALVLSAEFHGKRLVRFLVLLPWTTPIALGVLGWLWTLDNVYSPIDYVMRQVGLLGVGSPLGPDWFGTNSLWLAYPGPALRADRPRLAHSAAGDRDSAGGPNGDSPGRQGRRERRRRRILPPGVRYPHSAAAADHGGGGALRDRLHLHRHDRQQQ